MKCPFYKEEPQLRCTIHREYLYIPSAFQLKEYCGTGRHMICPFFSKNLAEIAKSILPQDDSSMQ